MQVQAATTLPINDHPERASKGKATQQPAPSNITFQPKLSIPTATSDHPKTSVAPAWKVPQLIP